MMMRGDIPIIFGRGLRYYAIFWFMFVLFASHLGILHYIHSEVNVPEIPMPTPTDTTPTVTTTDVLEIVSLDKTDDRFSVVFQAGSPNEANAQIYVSDLLVWNTPITPGYVNIYRYTARIPSGAPVVIRLVNAADGTVIKEVNA